MKEIPVQSQAVLSAFLGVELGCENIIARNRRSKASTVIGFPYAVARI